MKKKSLYEKTDLVVEAFKGISSKIKEQKNFINGLSVYLSSLITRIEAFEENIDRYQTSDFIIPILEIKNISRALNYSCGLLISKNISINQVPEKIKGEIKREKNKLTKILKEREIEDKEKAGVEHIYYDLKYLVEKNNDEDTFYKTIGSELESLLLENTENIKAYEKFKNQYDALAETNEEIGYERERIILIVRELQREGQIVKEVLSPYIHNHLITFISFQANSKSCSKAKAKNSVFIQTPIS